VGTASYAAQVHLRAMGMTDDEKQKYLDKNLAPGRLVAAAIQRTPYASFFPQLIDTAAETLYGQPVFDARGSGLSGNFLSGNPTVDTLTNATKGVGGLVQSVTRGRPLTRAEFISLMKVAPLSNTFPMQWLTNAMAENFPKHGAAKEKGSVLDKALD
jgi:hypothetical protein